MKKVFLLSVLLVFVGVMAVAVAPAVAGPTRYRPTHDANFSGSVTGVDDVQREKKGTSVHANPAEQTFVVTLGEVFETFAGSYSGYFFMNHLKSNPEFSFSWYEGGDLYAVQGVGSYTYNRRADTFEFVGTGDYDVIVRYDNTADWIVLLTVTPNVTVTGVPRD